jgi:hypothetical protein
MMYQVHLSWAGIELTTLVVIGTDWTVKEIGTGPTSDKFPDGPVVFINSPDRLSSKLFCQPLPLKIYKSRFSVNSKFQILFYLLFLDQEKSKIGKDTNYLQLLS